MYIKNINLRTYRNYDKLELDFTKHLNIIYGENAQGKTNILESIFLCASGRSHRTSKDTELVKVGYNGFYIKLDVQKKDRNTKIEIDYNFSERKRIKINEVPERKIGNLIGKLNTVIFSPEDLGIVKDGPSERRRFLDMTISQIKPSYFFELQQYAKILAHRNYLLKEIQVKTSLMDTLEVWNKKLAIVGSKIISVRKKFIDDLSIKAEKNHSKLTDGKEKLNLIYKPSIGISDTMEIGEIAKIFEQILFKSMHREILKGVTLYGPQRDDYDILLNNADIKVYGSQGQQRTCVLSIKLSEVDIMKEETQEFPVLLLDDVMSELDQKRQEYLLENIEGIQVFITCTDRDIFLKKNLSNVRYYKVENGFIT